MSELYLGHPRELIEAAIVLPSGHFVQLADPLFDRHGLGPRYAQVQTQDYRGHRPLSYAYLDLPATLYQLITAIDEPQDLGSYEDLTQNAELTTRLTRAWIFRHGSMPTPLQVALASIRAGVEDVQAGDELGVHRLVKWASIYEQRAHWIACHQQLAYVQDVINWRALRL